MNFNNNKKMLNNMIKLNLWIKINYQNMENKII